jgi:hypothetical protein
VNAEKPQKGERESLGWGHNRVIIFEKPHEKMIYNLESGQCCWRVCTTVCHRWSGGWCVLRLCCLGEAIFIQPDVLGESASLPSHSLNLTIDSSVMLPAL